MTDTPTVMLAGVEYYTATNASKVLGLSRQRTNTLIRKRNGGLEAVRHGHQWLVTKASVEDRLETHAR